MAKTAHDGGLRLAAFGDTTLITAGADERLRAWDAESGAFVSDAFAPVQIRGTRSPAPLQAAFLEGSALIPDGRHASLISLDSANETWRTPEAGHAGGVRACAGALSYTNGAVASAQGRVYVWGGGAWEGGIGNANGEDVSEVSWNGVPPVYACRGVSLGHKHGFLVFEKGVRGGA